MSVEGHTDFVKTRIKIYSIRFLIYYIMSHRYKAMKSYISLLIIKEGLIIRTSVCSRYSFVVC